eukprot:s335_g15.t1
MLAGSVHQQVEDDQRTQLQQKLEEQLKPQRVGKKGGQAAYSIGQLMQFMHLCPGSIGCQQCVTLELRNSEAFSYALRSSLSIALGSVVGDVGFDASDQKTEILMIEEFSARVISAIDMYLQDALAEGDIAALEDDEASGLQKPSPPPLRVTRRPLPIMALGQGVEKAVAAAPAVCIEEIWKETAGILGTRPVPGGLLALPSADAASSRNLLALEDDMHDLSGRSQIARAVAVPQSLGHELHAL